MLIHFYKTDTRAITTHFSIDEFACKCNTHHECFIDDELINKLDEMRVILDKPITVTSGYRCPAHNAAVKGRPDSQHLRGTAADIQIKGVPILRIAQVAEKVGFDGIGIYPTFVHVDVRGTKARWMGR